MAALDPSTLTYISLLLIQDLHRLWVSFERLSYGVSSGPEIGRRRGGKEKQGGGGGGRGGYLEKRLSGQSTSSYKHKD